MKVNQKILNATIAAAALAVSGSALAASGDMFNSPAVSATTPHQFYVSGNIGIGNVNMESKTIAGVKVRGKNETGVMGRIAAGYRFTPHFGVELGADKFSDAKIRVSAANAGYLDTTVKTYALDLLATATMPVDQDFSVFAKGGVAYVHFDGSNALGNGTTSKYRPELAAGVAYRVNQNVQFTAQYAHIFGQGNYTSSSYTPGLNAGTVGFEYDFS